MPPDGSESCTTPGPSTEELLARYRFRPRPLNDLSLGDLADLLLAYAAGEMSLGFLLQVTGLPGDDVGRLYWDAISRADRLCWSWRESEEARFRASLASSPSTATDTASSSSTVGGELKAE
jgi:hypothetical protein